MVQAPDALLIVEKRKLDDRSPLPRASHSETVEVLVVDLQERCLWETRGAGQGGG